MRPLPLDDRPLTEPRADRFDRTSPLAEQALAAHAAAMTAGEATYRDPITGYRVLTARALADRGTCCALGCRHCPYVADAPPPRRDGGPGVSCPDDPPPAGGRARPTSPEATT